MGSNARYAVSSSEMFVVMTVGASLYDADTFLRCRCCLALQMWSLRCGPQLWPRQVLAVVASAAEAAAHGIGSQTPDLGIVRRLADSRSEGFSTGGPPVVRPTQVSSTAQCSADEGAPFRSGSTVAQRPGPGFVQSRAAAAQ